MKIPVFVCLLSYVESESCPVRTGELQRTCRLCHMLTRRPGVVLYSVAIPVMERDDSQLVASHLVRVLAVSTMDGLERPLLMV